MLFPLFVSFDFVILAEIGGEAEGRIPCSLLRECLANAMA
jgi:hypothetical protein